MPTLNDPVRVSTDLSDDDLEHLHLLTAEWQLLADLSFADLLMWVRQDSGYVVVAQMRPTTGPTIHVDDLVGTTLAAGRRPLLDEAFDSGRIGKIRDRHGPDDVAVREEAVPVRRAGAVIAIVTRTAHVATSRTPSRLELTYLRCADDLAQMMSEGTFPHAGDAGSASAPRVGDGLLRLDSAGVVTYASPNALSAYRRLGLAADLVGIHLGRATATLARSEDPVDESLERVVSGTVNRQVDVEASRTVVVLRAIPLVPGGQHVGAVVLLRDVTELRRRERELMTKDATIREIHHRVKNNLQAVAALLRLQSRRMEVPEARAALQEAVRRVGSIAAVHETLSRSDDGAVDFDDVAGRLVAAAVDVVSAGASVTVQRVGSFGTLPAEIATPLALVLNELVQNAVEHGLGDDAGTVRVVAERTYGRAGRLLVAVEDSGAGLPEGFDMVTAANLGLSIVGALVRDELNGTLAMAPAPGGGTRVSVDLEAPDVLRGS